MSQYPSVKYRRHLLVSSHAPDDVVWEPTRAAGIDFPTARYIVQCFVAYIPKEGSMYHNS
jgi:hypothetical protein